MMPLKGMSSKERRSLLIVAAIAIVPSVIIGMLVTATLYRPDRMITLSVETPNPAVPQNQPGQRASQPPIGLEGYCPVSLVQRRVWTPGDKRWKAVHEGRVYLFAGLQQQQQFFANPILYAPLLSGYDLVQYAETGQIVLGRREFGLYVDEPGPIALFADEAALERFLANSAYYYNVIRQTQVLQSPNEDGSTHVGSSDSSSSRQSLSRSNGRSPGSNHVDPLLESDRRLGPTE